MNMVFMSTNLHRVTFQVFTYPADIIVKIGFDRIIDQVFFDVAHFGASTFVDIRIKTFILSRTAAQTKSTRIKQI